MADENRRDEDRQRSGQSAVGWRGREDQDRERFGGGQSGGFGREDWRDDYGQASRRDHGQPYGQNDYGPEHRGYGQSGYGGQGPSQSHGQGQAGHGQSGYQRDAYGQPYRETWYGERDYRGGYGQAGHERSRYAGGYGGGYTQDYRDVYGGEWGSSREHRPGGQPGHDRNWWDKTRDEVGSWFGDDEAERRRRMDGMRAEHRGRGPKSYRRSDDRIREDVNDRLTDDPFLDASHIEVTVSDGEVTLTGTVDDRRDKRRAEDLAEDCSGVKHLQNNLRVQSSASNLGTSSTTSASGGAEG